jgi:hypothetical protein
MTRPLRVKRHDRKASLNLKGPFGVTNLKVCSQKIVTIFSFFLFGPAVKNFSFFQGNLPDFDYFNYGPEKLSHRRERKLSLALWHRVR